MNFKEGDLCQIKFTPEAVFMGVGGRLCTVKATSPIDEDLTRSANRDLLVKLEGNIPEKMPRVFLISPNSLEPQQEESCQRDE